MNKTAATPPPAAATLPAAGAGDPALEHAALRGLDPAVHGSPRPAPRRGLDRLVAFDHCRVEAPAFSFAGKTDPLSRLHRLALAAESPGSRHPPGAARGALAYALHLAVSLRQGALYFHRYSTRVARSHGVSRLRQLRDLARCMWKNNQFARHYYWRGLYLCAHPADWLAHLEHRQLTALLSALLARVPSHRIANKFLFAEHCRLHRLPAPPTLAAWNAAGEELTAPAPLPPVDLFVKPFAEYGGVGALHLPYDPSTRRHALAGEWLPEAALRTRLAARALGQGCLVQPHLGNSRAGAALFGRSELANLRLVTGLSPGGGEPRLLGAGLRVPSRFTTLGHDRHVLMARVDLTDGRLGPARFRNTSLAVFPLHPDTGARLEGTLLPGWADMVATALAAHRTLPWMPFVGWDLAATDDGPVIIEANAFWSAHLVQLPGALPLGRTAFTDLYLEWYRHLHPEAASAFSVPSCKNNRRR